MKIELWEPIESFASRFDLKGVIMMRAKPEPLLLIHEPIDAQRFRRDFFGGRWKALLSAREVVIARHQDLVWLLREHHRLYGFSPAGNYTVLDAVYF